MHHEHQPTPDRIALDDAVLTHANRHDGSTMVDRFPEWRLLDQTRRWTSTLLDAPRPGTPQAGKPLGTPPRAARRR